MHYVLKRRSTYCHRVERFINYEMGISLSNNELQYTTTCTGIEDVCFDCPLVLMNEKHTFPSDKKQ